MKMKTFAYRSYVVFMCFIICSMFSNSAEAKEGIETAGEILRFALPASAAGAALATGDTEGLVQLSKSGAVTLGVTYGLKYAIDAERPNGDDHSFPSSHASTSFAAAEFIRGRYGWSYGIPAYAVAAFVAYSRIESKQHHTRDVVAGAVIGIGSSYLFTSPYKGWQVAPQVGSSFYGVGLSRTL